MSGYIGNIPTPQATQTRDTFTATAGQTTFATSGYTPSFLDVFLNGVHLVNGTDYTATNGSDVVLTSGAAAGDTLEMVAYSTYQVNSQNYTGGLTVDNDGATVLTVDRATSHGTIMDLQKDGSSIGTFGSSSGNLIIDGTDTATKAGLGIGGSVIYPRKGAADNDNGVDLGNTTRRFKNLYLSGGVYLGGTGGANYLEDYEEGVYTALLTTGSGSITLNSSYNTLAYTKIGRQVTITGRVRVSSVSSPNGNVQINLPFTSSNQIEEAGRAYFHLALYDVDIPDTNRFSVFAECGELASVATFIYERDSVPWEVLPASGFKSSSFFYFGGTYLTDS